MSEHRYLKCRHQPPLALAKDFITVGFGPGYDLSLDESKGSGVAFSLRRDEKGYSLLPGTDRLLINGRAVRHPTLLETCDRLECRGEVVLYLDESIRPDSQDSPKKHRETTELKLLKDLTGDLALEEGMDVKNLNLSLELLVEYCNAEGGVLLCESKEGAEWSILTANGVPIPQNPGGAGSNQRRALLSHTLLAECIRTGKPVFIESIVGHELESQASILEAQLFSIACAPLSTGTDRIFGALFLYTRTPGKTLDPDALEGAAVIAAQISRLHLSQRALTAVKSENVRLRQSPTEVASNLIFDRAVPSSPMQALWGRIQKLSDHELSILIRGETGTGKELIAREIHEKSKRSRGPFIAINCAAIPPTLIESLLFGHSKGSFTGAAKDTRGKFLQANHGTIFLDEIGDLPADLQTKLLRVIQENEVEPVGADRPISIDIRVLSATHQDLEVLVRDGKFRSDLFYCLNGATVQVPPLRERGATDIRLLAEHFLREWAPQLQFSKTAIDLIETYSWPGNVRELQQAIRRGIALCSGSEVHAEDLEIRVSSPVPAGALPVAPTDTADLGDLDDLNLKEGQIQFTKRFVQQVLNRCDGNRSRAASHLGISERTLYRLLAPDRPNTDI